MPSYQLKDDRYSSHSLILSSLGKGDGRRLLDVGAADGFLAEKLTAQGFEVTCIEGDTSLAAKAEGKCSRLIVADLDETPPQLSGKFDVIVYGDILEHLKDPLRVITALNANLKPDGIVIVSVPNVSHLWVRWQLLRGRFEYTDRGILDRTHLRFFTLKSFQRFLADAHLQILRMYSTPVPLPLVVAPKFQGSLFRTVHAINALSARIWKTLLAYQFLAVARRSAQ